MDTSYRRCTYDDMSPSTRKPQQTWAILIAGQSAAAAAPIFDHVHRRFWYLSVVRVELVRLPADPTAWSSGDATSLHLIICFVHIRRLPSCALTIMDCYSRSAVPALFSHVHEASWPCTRLSLGWSGCLAGSAHAWSTTQPRTQKASV
jgi:hypothetical protein